MVSVRLWTIGWIILVVFLVSLGYVFLSPWGKEMANEYSKVGEFLGAFATPLIAAIALYIAFRQHRNDEQKLLFDAYDKRHLVYAKAWHRVWRAATCTRPQCHVRVLSL